jgi:hypothetical protein
MGNGPWSGSLKKKRVAKVQLFGTIKAMNLLGAASQRRLLRNDWTESLQLHGGERAERVHGD